MYLLLSTVLHVSGPEHWTRDQLWQLIQAEVWRLLKSVLISTYSKFSVMCIDIIIDIAFILFHKNYNFAILKHIKNDFVRALRM